MKRSLIVLTGLLVLSAHAQKKAPRYDESVPTPTRTGIRYGEHEKHVMDFWQAKSDTPTPLVFVIHGGGWVGGSKERVDKFCDPAALLESGISVVAINYRLMGDIEEGVMPPVKVPLYDAARALQFVRTKAKEWNLDSSRIALVGGSAGGCSSLWLATHEDLADPDSDDPVARESTRVFCAAVWQPQTSLDPKQMREWIPNIGYGGHAFGVKGFGNFLGKREELMPWIQEYSPHAQLTKDDPPTYMLFIKEPKPDDKRSAATHSASFGIHFQKKAEALGVECEVVYPGAPNVKFETTTDYLIHKLNMR